MPVVGESVLKPYWTTADRETVRYYLGDVLKTLRRLPARSVQEVVTSPPYWGLRSYLDNRHEQKYAELGSEASPDCLGWARGENCAERDWAIGCHVCRMVLVCREVRRVLRGDGTFWLNYGDTYAASGRGLGGTDKQKSNSGAVQPGVIHSRRPVGGLKNGDLVGVPWRVALALQADGWVLRQDIVWSKPSPMPESVRNRCTKAHEYVFLLTKSERYYYDMEAIREKTGRESTVEEYSAYLEANGEEGNSDWYQRSTSRISDKSKSGNPVPRVTHPSGRNKRSVWSVDDRRALIDWLGGADPELLVRFLEEAGYKGDVWRISSQGYPGAHFATFPPKLIEPMILAGTSAKGACAECGAPWRRVTEQRQLKRERPNDYVKRTGAEGTGNSCANTAAGVEVKTVGWEPTCTCFGRFERRKVTRVKVVGAGPNEEGKMQTNPDTRQSGSSTLYAPGNHRSARGTPVEVEEERPVYTCNCGTVWPSGGGAVAEGNWQERKAAGSPSGLKTIGMNANHGDGMSRDLTPKAMPTRERQDPCDCYRDRVRPCVVLDPFIGSGTTAAVAVEHGRHCWGIELSEVYLRENAVPRVEGVLLSRPATRGLVPVRGEGSKPVELGKPTRRATL